MKTSSKKWQKIRKIKGLRQFVTWYPRHVSENPGYKLLKKLVSMNGMKCSEYLRGVAFGGNGGKAGNFRFAVKAQELLNYLEDNCAVADNKLEKKVDELWKSLL